MAESKSRPKLIGVLDIETKAPISYPISSAEIACVAFRKYKLKDAQYKEVQTLIYAPDSPKHTLTISQLQKELEDFKGPIIGHNILDFDVQILSTKFSVKALVPKVVDLLVILAIENEGYTAGLNLEDIARSLDFDLGKIERRGVFGLAREHDWNAVIEHCLQDVDSTFELWRHLADGRSIVRRGKHSERIIRISTNLKSALLGEKPLFDYALWKKAKDHYGRILTRKRLFEKEKHLDFNQCPRCGKIYRDSESDQCSKCRCKLEKIIVRQLRGSKSERNPIIEHLRTNNVPLR